MKQRVLFRSLVIVMTGMLLSISNRTVLAQAEVRMKNGSVLYGEVKKLEFAKLTLDTDDFDLIEIDWDPIAYVKAPGPFTILLSTGERYTGSIEVDSAMVMIDGENPISVPRDQLALFADFDEGFWDQVSAGVDIGANFVRGNNTVTSTSLGINLGWETDDTRILLNASALTNDQQDAPDLRRYTTDISLIYQVLDRVGIGASAGFERDENQDLEYRVPIIGLVGFSAIATQRSRLDLVAGGGPTFEKFFSSEASTVGEARAGLAFKSRPNGDMDIDFSAFVIPSLFDFDRVRVASDFVFRVEIISDLTFNTTAYFRYNDSPPEGIENTDYGLTLGLGWSY